MLPNFATANETVTHLKMTGVSLEGESEMESQAHWKLNASLAQLARARDL